MIRHQVEAVQRRVTATSTWVDALYGAAAKMDSRARIAQRAFVNVGIHVQGIYLPSSFLPFRVGSHYTDAMETTSA
jgi:hypothetical protein